MSHKQPPILADWDSPDSLPVVSPILPTVPLKHNHSSPGGLSFWDKVYDTVNIIITILDLVTDILVIYDFHTNQRYIFFWLALGCVVIAHICYILVFIVKYSNSYDSPNEISVFIGLIPIAPLLPYILYWSTLPNNCFSNLIFPIFGFEKDEWEPPKPRTRFVDYGTNSHGYDPIHNNYNNYIISNDIDIDIDNNDNGDGDGDRSLSLSIHSVDDIVGDRIVAVNIDIKKKVKQNMKNKRNKKNTKNNKDRKKNNNNFDSFDTFGGNIGEPNTEEWKNWAKQKIMTNIGFIIEGLIQSFPEAIIQVIAIVYYKEYDNYISLSSILLSLLSVCVKSLILTQGINTLLRIFKWLCAVTDFFAIFVMVSWAFYSTNDHDSNGFGLIFGTLAIEIGHLCFYAFLSHIAIDERFHSDSTKDFINKIVQFIRYGNSEDKLRIQTTLQYCKQSDYFKREYIKRVGATDNKTKRLFSTNITIDDSYSLKYVTFSADDIFFNPDKEYTSRQLFDLQRMKLKHEDEPTSFIALGWKAWKKAVRREWRRVFDNLYERKPFPLRIWSFVFIFLVLTTGGPLYAISRVFTFFYPFLAIINALYGKNDYQWFVFDFKQADGTTIGSVISFINDKIPYFPGIVTLIYLVLLLWFFILGIYTFRFMDLCFLIYPTNFNYCDLGGKSSCKRHWNNIMKYYNWQKNKPIVDACVIDIIAGKLDYNSLGIDIAYLILSFLPKNYFDVKAERMGITQTSEYGRFRVDDLL